MENYKKYYVTYVNYFDGRYHFHSTDVEVYVKPNLSRGQLAQILENQVSSILDDVTVTILNFWEI